MKAIRVWRWAIVEDEKQSQTVMRFPGHFEELAINLKTTGSHSPQTISKSNKTWLL